MLGIKDSITETFKKQYLKVLEKTDKVKSMKLTFSYDAPADVTTGNEIKDELEKVKKDVNDNIKDVSYVNNKLNIIFNKPLDKDLAVDISEQIKIWYDEKYKPIPVLLTKFIDFE